MENKKQHMVYGLIGGLGMVIISLIIYVTGLTAKPGLQYLTYIPFITAIILNAIAFSKSRDGFVTFGNVFGNCFKACLIVAIIIVAWSIISTLAFPDMKTKALEIARDAMAKNPKINDEQIDTGMRMVEKFYTPMLIAGSIFNTLFFGAIFSLIGAMVAKKKGPLPITADNF